MRSIETPDDIEHKYQVALAALDMLIVEKMELAKRIQMLESELEKLSKVLDAIGR
jgi:hypothetical protein